MDASKRNKVIYWVLAALVLLPMVGGGLFEVFTDGPENVVKSMAVLGYPLYLLKILGTAKILGGIAIVTGYSPNGIHV